jgi:hypothetical protein
VHGGGDSFPPEVSRQVLGFEHAARHGHDTLVPVFHHPILLRGIRSGELPVHAALRTVPAKINRSEFPPTISAEDLQLSPSLHFNTGLEVLDHRRRMILAW